MRTYLRKVMAKRDAYMAPRNPQQRETQDDLPTAQDRLKGIESWYENNKKILNGVLLGVLVLVAGLYAYNNFLQKPKNQKANEAIFMAQQYFAMDSMNLALNGDGNNYGFLKIIDKYGSTDAGNLSKFYAGRILLGNGEFDKAIKYLKDFDGEGTLVATVAQGNLGDAYMELGKTNDAIGHYKTATADDNDMFLTPLYLERLALAYELDGKEDKAIEAYKRIRTQFGSSTQARNAEKYLARLGDFSI